MSVDPAALPSSTWRPRWAIVVAVLFGIPAVVSLVIGVWTLAGYAGWDRSMADLILTLGATLAVGSLPALVCLGIFLTRGGKVPFAAEVVYVVLAVTLLRIVMTGGASFGWLAYIPIP